MSRTARMTVLYQPVEDGWIQGSVVELPGVITTGRSLDEAKEMIRDALVEYLASFDPRDIAVRRGAEIDELEISITP